VKKRIKLVIHISLTESDNSAGSSSETTAGLRRCATVLRVEEQRVAEPGRSMGGCLAGLKQEVSDGREGCDYSSLLMHEEVMMGPIESACHSHSCLSSGCE
jgi:hypothetical protein